jgi:hypothetical protein
MATRRKYSKSPVAQISAPKNRIANYLWRTKLPRKIENDLLGGEIKKVLHASFGSDADSFFFTYEMKNGSVAHRAGKAIPAALDSFVKHISAISEEHISALRVLLGAYGSYIAWAGAVWISHGK